MNPHQLNLAQQGLAAARAYAHGVLTGEIIACRWVKLAVARDERDRAKPTPVVYSLTNTPPPACWCL